LLDYCDLNLQFCNAWSIIALFLDGGLTALNYEYTTWSTVALVDRPSIYTAAYWNTFVVAAKQRIAN